MDKEEVVVDVVGDDHITTDLLVKNPCHDCKSTTNDLQQQYFDNEDKKLFELKQITSPKENELNLGDPSTSKILEHYKTPHSNKRNINASSIQRESETLDTPVSVTKTRQTPLPLMKWADSTEVWQNMVYKEEVTLKSRSSKLLLEQNTYLPRMRAILLDWIMEVCEVYHLGRTTYYLAVDYIDRFLTMKPTIPKTQLQLLGVTCLFVAAKLEEIYPPKLSEFAYVCDGACTVKEILACEVLILNTLDWDVNPMTPTGWLNLYMQIHYDVTNLTKQKMHVEVTTNFQFPQYSGYEFTRASHVMDLFSMDPGFLEFSYSIVAAGAMYYVFGKEVALKVSGLTWPQLEPCVDYMYVFYKVINDSNDPRLLVVPSNNPDDRLHASFKALQKRNPFIVSNENHRLQTHVIDLDYFEKTAKLRSEMLENKVEEDHQNDNNQKAESEIVSDAEVITEIEKILEEHYFSSKDLTCNEKTHE